jgi:hypothetical protein
MTVTTLDSSAVAVASPTSTSALLGGSSPTAAQLAAAAQAEPKVALYGAQAIAASVGGAATRAADRPLVAYLEAHRDGARFLVAATGAFATEPIILDSAQPVLTIGGYDGTDPDPSLAAFEQLARSGAVRYVLLPAVPPDVALPGEPPIPGDSGISDSGVPIDYWVYAHATNVAPALVGGATGLYLLNSSLTG